MTFEICEICGKPLSGTQVNGRCSPCFWHRVSIQRDEEAKAKKMEHDPVNHPRHYTQHPSGVECIEITEHMNFCVGNAVKYLWRADEKGGLEDLKKAAWYINREIQRRENYDAVQVVPSPATIDELVRKVS